MKKRTMMIHAIIFVIAAAVWALCEFVLAKGSATDFFGAVGLVWMCYGGLILILSILSGVKSMQTVCSMFSSIAKYAAVLVTIFWGLSILGVNTTALLATAGVLTLVIGFGAQSLIEDVITGMFIIFEGQYKIGDILVLDDFRGTVINVGVRTTTLEDAGGNRKVVNNSDIRNFQNRSRNNSVAICEISIEYEQDIEEFEKIMAKELPAIYETHKDLFEAVPEYKGIEKFEESGILVRFVVRVPENRLFDARRALNREIRLMFARNNIGIPYPHMVVKQ